MSDQTFDLLIMGAGPGGYTAAIRAARRGACVALLADAAPGGTCLHLGCIPTKTLLTCTELFAKVRRAAEFGLDLPGQARLQLEGMSRRRRKVVSGMASGLEFLLRKNGVTVIQGRATLAGNGPVSVGGRTLGAPRIILATGSRPAPSPAGLPPVDGERVLNSNHALRLAEPPNKLLVVGGGYIGCEFASVFRAVGSEVTVLEAMDRLLPGMDAELGEALAKSFRKAGIEVQTGTKIAGFDACYDRVLVAVGRVPATEGLGCETAGVKLAARGHVEVNERMETSAPGIYAIGDLVGRGALAHVASAQARVAVENALGGRATMDYTAVPAVVFTHPETASVGLTEAEARAQGRPVRVGRFPFAALGRAQASGETEGFVKLVADAETHRVVGGQVFGQGAGELIATITVAVTLGATAEQLAHAIYAHPTFAEGIGEAAESVFGSPVHIYRPPR